MMPIMSFLITFLFFQLLPISFCNGSTNVGCMETERKALLMFKQDLTNTSNRLDSWAGDGDCCKWVGVVCDNLTGHVLELHLGNPHTEIFVLGYDYDFTTLYDAYKRSRMGGKLNPSLLDLKHLDYLDLSFNFFEGIRIPEFLGSMESLTYLNLSSAGFSGMIPHQLGNLSNLRYFDLSYNYYNTSAENLFWLSSLPLLEHLDLSGVNLSRAYNWLLEINTLPFLKVLKLSSCELQRFPPLSIANFSSLITLDLSYNFPSLSNPMIPSWVFGLSHLLFLDMCHSEFRGPIPNGLQNLTFLRHLDLSQNHFNSSIPTWMHRFTHLEYLDLQGNNLQGMISDAIANLTFIETLDLSYNYKLEGRISSSFGQLCNLRSIYFSYIKLSQAISEILNVFSPCISDKLESLYLSSTQIFGSLPDHQLGKLKNLQVFFLQNNSIVGPIPPSLGKLWSLRYFDVSFNKLNGTLSQIHFKNLTKILIFDASENSLTLTINPGWIPPFQLNELSLRSCHLGPRFPLWLYSQKFLSWLDISNSGISDSIPNKFWKSLPRSVYLNISHNHIHGKIPYLLKGIRFYFLDLSSNNLSGPLPLIYPLYTLDLSNNNFSGSISHFVCHRMHEYKKTDFLKLRGNFLSGELSDCWMTWPFLKILDLGNNKFTGNIPVSMGTLSELQWLHLRKNNLSGTIPTSLGNCTKLGTLDIGENELVGTIPTWMGERLSSIMILNLRSNKFHGFLPSELCNLAHLQIIDLAQNNIFGAIPRCINNISAMVTMNHSVQNGVSLVTNYTAAVEDALLVMKGQTAEYSTILNLVRSIDLSENKFSGEIPIEMTHLKALQSLNLSYNSFTGRIPANFGAMRLLESADFSSNKLSGEIPQSISNLTFLSYLNLSNNNLIGKIPLSTQLQSLDASCFIGNELCGAPLPKDCTKTSPTLDPENGGGNDDEEHKVDWFYVSMALGFAVGFWSLIGPLLANRRWRYMYSCFLDRLGFMLVDVVSKCCQAFQIL